MQPTTLSKETLLRQVDGLRDIARRSRRLSEMMNVETDRERLMRHSKELDDRASVLEKQAIEAKTGQLAPSSLSAAARPNG